jgi:hypothetical protein
VAGSPVKRFRRLLDIKDEDGLTPQERMFCSRYQTHWDVMRALRESFGATKLDAKKVLNKAEVQAVIQRETAARNKMYEFQPDWVLRELAMSLKGMRFSNFIESCTCGGHTTGEHAEDCPVGKDKPIYDWTEEAEAAVASVEEEPVYDYVDGKKRIVKYRRKLRFHSKTELLALILRHMGLDHLPSAEGRDRLKEMLAVFQAGPVPRTIEGEVTEKMTVTVREEPKQPEPKKKK